MSLNFSAQFLVFVIFFSSNELSTQSSEITPPDQGIPHLNAPPPLRRSNRRLTRIGQAAEQQRQHRESGHSDLTSELLTTPTNQRIPPVHSPHVQHSSSSEQSSSLALHNSPAGHDFLAGINSPVRQVSPAAHSSSLAIHNSPTGHGFVAGISSPSVQNLPAVQDPPSPVRNNSRSRSGPTPGEHGRSGTTNIHSRSPEYLRNRATQVSYGVHEAHSSNVRSRSPEYVRDRTDQSQGVFARRQLFHGSPSRTTSNYNGSPHSSVDSNIFNNK